MVKGYDVGKLYIKKHTLPEWLTLYLVLFPFIKSLLLDFLHLPSFLKYTMDVAWIAIMLLIFLRKSVLLLRRVAPFVLYSLIFFLLVLTVYLFNYQSPFYFLWGIRNNFRMYAAFIAYIVFLTDEDIKSFFKFGEILFWLNLAVTLYQFFVMGLNQDYLGGIFGVERGCNGYSILFLAIILCKSLLSYMDGEEGTVSCFVKCGSALVIAAMAELKLFFLIFVFILLMSAILTRFSWQKLVVIFFSAILLSFAGSILVIVFGEGERLDFDRIMELLTSSNYATATDLGRFTALPTISDTILTSFPEKIFGLGLGNCDTSAFAICNTPFFINHEALHYTWFSSAFLFLETGYLGLAIFLSFFLIVFIKSASFLKNGRSDRLYSQISIIVSMLCVILTFYNSTLRTETGYIAYFALALPFVAKVKN